MYQALYRKWRPRSFDEVVGQEHITETLKRQIETGRLSHAYLFTGTRGTGKTTCAKLLARAVNCQSPVDGSPCNRCSACQGIENGSILDVLELDAASNNRVDDIRAILDEAVYAPAAVRKRVYIVDEVHMLSGQAFNALLQILEEPPEHLLFILATTEIHKVPATIKSRCQQFSFKRIRAEEICQRLRYVAGQEGIDLTDGGADLIARLADGGMRDALSLLDQCAGAGARVDEERVYDVLGLAGNLETAGLMDHIADGDAAAALEQLGRLYAGGREMSALVGELSSLVRDLLIRRAAPNSGSALMTGGFDETTLKRLEGRFDTPRLVQMLTLLQSTAADLARSANRRTDVELCLTILCDPTLDQSPAGLNARLSRLEAGVERTAPPPQEPPKEAPRPREEVPCATAEEPRPPVEEDAPPWDIPEKPADAPPPAVEEKKGPDQETPSDPEEPPALAEQPARETPSAPAEPSVRKASPAPAARWPGWAALRESLRGDFDVADFSFLGNPQMVGGSLEGDALTLWAQSGFVKDMIDKPDMLTIVSRRASVLAGREVRVSVKVGKAPEERVPPIEGFDPLEGFLSGAGDNITVE